MRQIVLVTRAALVESYANRRAFYTKVSLMAINDVTWAIFYSVLLSRAGSIRGWDVDDVFLLFATFTTVLGFGIGLAGNSRKLSQLINDGGLDAALTLPMSPLSMLLFRRAEPSAIGDGIFGLSLFFIFCDPTPERTLLFLVCAALGAVVLVSFLTLVGSAAFFSRGNGDQGDFVFNGMLAFASYPTELFGGITKVILFSVLPVAFIGSFPADLVRDFDAYRLAILAGFALGLALLARSVFYLGLKRYRSGALWTQA